VAVQPTIKVTGRLEKRESTNGKNNGQFYRMMLAWTDASGKRQRKSFTTGLPVKGNKMRAEAMLREKIQEQEILVNATPARGEDLLFADFMEEWLESVNPAKANKNKAGIKLITFGGYQMNVQKVIAPWFRERGILLRDLTAEDINDFYDDQLERVKASSVHKFHANISKALKYAVRKGYVDSARAIMERVNRPKAEKYVGKFLRQSEVEELYEAVKGHKLELGVLLGAYYGLRRSEIVGLRWSSIDFQANTITIEHTVTVANIDGKNVIIADDTTKTQSSLRTLPLTPVLRAKLLAVRAEQEQYRKLCGKSYNKDEGKYIYTDALGNRIKPDYLSGQFPIFLERNGFRHIRFHDLRHSCASLLLANGVSLKQIQDWLGHSTFKTTADIYAHLESDSKLAAAAALTWIDNTSLAQESVDVSESDDA
jgi:integrase